MLYNTLSTRDKSLYIGTLNNNSYSNHTDFYFGYTNSRMNKPIVLSNTYFRIFQWNNRQCVF